MKKIPLLLLSKLRDLPGIDWAILGGGLATYISLAWSHISASGIWFDEAFSAYLMRFNFIDIARYTATDVHPPLYYWMLKLWSGLFGASEIALRSMSVLFGAVAIVFGFLLVKRLFGRKASTVSLLLLVISPMLIRYGEEARMYTMAAAITLAATYALTFAVNTKKRLPWVIYGILVSLGMWTHYFTSLVWLTHWAWRLVVKRQTGKRGKDLKIIFFSNEWIFAHIIAVVMFVPWGIVMLIQLAIVQGGGFWIGPVSASSFTNYMTNLLFYLEHEPAVGLYGTALAAIIAVLSIFGLKLYRSLDIISRQNYLLIIFLAFVPVILLFIISTPPIRSSFVERYLIPSVIGFSLFAGVTMTLGFAKLKAVWRVLAVGLIASCMVFGIANVYYYGNFNKNNPTRVMTREVVQTIQASAPAGEPIIVGSPWVFYEAIFYNTARNPIYFVDARTDYKISSLDMLRENDNFKIKDLNAFIKDYPKVWYIDYSADSQLSPPNSDWKEIQNFSVFDNIVYKDPYKAAEYQTN
jgi:uncharacterized membrane protein